METTGVNENHEIRRRCAAIQLGTEEETSNTQACENLTTTLVADNILKSLSPLINSMRLFGLYFSPKPQVGPEITHQMGKEAGGRCCKWNPGPARIYATIILVAVWVNAVRYYTIFYGIDSLGIELLQKLAEISNVLLTVVLHTAYYVASHTGSLERVFRQVNLSAADIYPKYRRRAKVMTFVCWALMAFCVLCYIFPMLIKWDYSDQTLLIFINTFHISKPHAYIILAIFIILEIQHSASWVYPQATNNIVYYFNQTLLLTFSHQVLRYL